MHMGTAYRLNEFSSISIAMLFIGTGFGLQAPSITGTKGVGYFSSRWCRWIESESGSGRNSDQKGFLSLVDRPTSMVSRGYYFVPEFDKVNRDSESRFPAKCTSKQSTK